VLLLDFKEWKKTKTQYYRKRAKKNDRQSPEIKMYKDNIRKKILKNKTPAKPSVVDKTHE